MIDISSGWKFNSALLPGGVVKVWGIAGHVPNVPGGTLNDVQAMDAGAGSLLVLFNNGTVSVHHSPSSIYTAPVPPGLGPCMAVAAGYPYHAAIRTNGEFVVWPAGLEIPPGNTFGVAKFELGYSNLVMLRTDGSLVVGTDPGGQSELRAIPPGIYSSAIEAVDIYGLHAAVLRADGSIRCWGSNTYGECNVPSDLGPCMAVATGYYHTLALGLDGRVRGWGFSGYGEASAPPGKQQLFARIAAAEDTSVAFSTPTTDCDGNGIADPAEIAESPWLDCNENDLLDVCLDQGSASVPIKWTAVSGGGFQDPANWCFFTPTNTSSISFPYDREYNVEFTQNRTVRNMRVDGGFPTLNLAGRTLTLSSVSQPTQSYLRVGNVSGTPASLGVLGGSIGAAFTEIGHAAGSQGSFFVGFGGIAVSSQEICVGCAAPGGMSVLSGGRVVSQKGVIGRVESAPGTVLVEGFPGDPDATPPVPPRESKWESTLGVDVRNGVLTVGELGVIDSPAVGVVLYSGGVLQGSGRINGTVTNFGAAAGNCGYEALAGSGASHRRGGLVPGGALADGSALHGATSIGTLTINGTYQQIASNPLLGTNSGSLLVEVVPGATGPRHDRLVVNGTASFGGGLFIDFPAGDPGDFESLPVVTSTSVDPNRPMFDLAVMPGLPDGRFVKVDPVQALAGGGSGIAISTSSLGALLGFGESSDASLDLEPLAAAVADFDGKDGPDLAVTVRGATPGSNGSLFVLFNDGNGGLSGALQLPGALGVDPVDVVAAPLRTGAPTVDLAVVNRGSGTLQVLWNDGTGVFTSAGTTSTGAGSEPVALAAAPIYSDPGLVGAARDLIVANSGTNEVLVFRNLGAGFPWPLPIVLPAPIRPSDVDGVDVDNNRSFDTILLTSRGSSTVTAYSFDPGTPKDGDEGFGDGIDFLVGEDPASMVVADLDGDGLLDVTTVNEASDSLSVLVNRTLPGGGLNFAPAVSLPTGGDPVSVVAGDFDLDTLPGEAPDLDLAFTARATVAESSPRVVKILRNDRQNGVLVLAPAEDQAATGSPRIVLAGEMDQEVGVDLVTVALGGGGGAQAVPSAGTASVLPALAGKTPCAAGDVNCDGMVDATDLAALLAAWGTAETSADFDRNGTVDAADLATLLANWGGGQS